MKILTIIISILILFGCRESVEENRSARYEKENISTNDSLGFQSAISEDSMQIDTKELQSKNVNKLREYFYPNLTAWGGLTLMYDEKDLKIIEAINNAEFGFRKVIYYIEDGSIKQIEYEIHDANWNEYDNSKDFDESRMTYTDRKVIYDYNDIKTSQLEGLKRLIKEGIQILNFIKVEKIDISNK